jgi:hypothetical protein
MFIKESCLSLTPLMDKLILSENSSKLPRKYIKEIKLKSIAEAHIIPTISMHSIMNFHQILAFLLNRFISGSETSESVSSILDVLAGIALLSFVSFEVDINLESLNESSSSNTNGFVVGFHLTDPLFLFTDIH